MVFVKPDPWRHPVTTTIGSPALTKPRQVPNLIPYRTLQSTSFNQSDSGSATVTKQIKIVIASVVTEVVSAYLRNTTVEWLCTNELDEQPARVWSQR